MRFFVDENETAAIIPPLQLVLYEHEFAYADEVGLSGIEDIDLFYEVASRGYQAIITRDRNQLADRDEREALISSNLHWIGHKEPTATGELLVACLTAGYLLALPHIIQLSAELEAPHAFHVRNIEWQQGQRVIPHRLKL